MENNRIIEIHDQREVEKAVLVNNGSQYIKVLIWVFSGILAYFIGMALATTSDSFGLVILISIIIFLGIPIAFSVFKSYQSNRIKQEYLNGLKRNRDKNDAYISEIIQKRTAQGFCETKRFKDVFSKYAICIDSNNQTFILIFPDQMRVLNYKFSDLIDFEIYNNGKSFIVGDVNSAFTDGLLYGKAGVAAAIAAPQEIQDTCSDLHILIRVNDVKNPQVKILLITDEVPKNSEEYRFSISTAKEIIAILSYVKENGKIKDEKQNSSPISWESRYEELEKLFELKEKKIITDEEYNEMKKRILLNENIVKE